MATDQSICYKFDGRVTWVAMRQHINCDRNVHWRCLLQVSAMCEQQARLLIHSRDSPASSRLEFGPHLCSCSSCMFQVGARLVNYLCVHVALLVTRSGSSQDDATSPSSVTTFSRCRNLPNIFLISTVVDCGPLTDPANGQVIHTVGTTFGQTATYICNTGYSLVGDSTRTCQATGNWSGSAPTCQGVCVYELINPFLSNGDEIGIV